MEAEIRILFLTAEATPFVKVGGLGDVAGSLPEALHNLNETSPRQSVHTKIDVRLVLPLYKKIRSENYNLKQLHEFIIPSINKQYKAVIYYYKYNSIPIYFISGDLFEKDNFIYSNNAVHDGLKFIFFSLASLQLPKLLNWQPNIIHANEWHTAITPYVLKNQKKNISNIKTILGVHNLPYLGQGTSQVLTEFGIPSATDHRLPKWARHLPMPLGLLAADQIVAVSPTYAKEILTPEFGSGLESFLKTRNSKWN